MGPAINVPLYDLSVRHQIRIGTRQVSYLDETGPPPARARSAPRVVVLIHAFPLSSLMWEPQLKAVPAGWRFIAPDLPGLGLTDPIGSDQDAASMDDYAAAVIDLLDHLHIHDAVIAGVSMGGYVTFAVQRVAPRYVCGLILADTRPQADSEEGRGARRTMQDLLAREGAAGIATDMIPKLLGPQTRRDQPALAAHVRSLIESNAPGGLAAAIARMMNRPDSTPQLSGIRCPTLILVGEEDGLTPVSDSELMHRHIAGSLLEVIPAAGHLSSIEQPDRFNAALTRFLVDRL